MLWNWQLSDWTQFAFDEARLRDAEARFLKGAGVVVGSMRHLDGEARQEIVIELISQEMVDSSAIEGEILDRVSVQSSIARQLGFAADKPRSHPVEAGVAELMAGPLSALCGAADRPAFVRLAQDADERASR